jgi:hypothetical protein
MYTNRFFTALIIVALTAVVGLTVREAVVTSAFGSELEEAERIQQTWAADTARWEAMGEYYANQAAAQRMDSATRSYIAWGQAMQVSNAIDSGTRSYIAWGEALEKAKLNALDSGTRSYIAWGEALEAAGKLGDSGACSNTTQQNIFAGIPNNLDSATRSYIAWGLALQPKNDIGALCR